MIFAGYDVSYSKESNLAVACLCIFENQDFVNSFTQEFVPTNNYVPGKLYLREQKGLDLLLPKLKQTNKSIDVLVIDGNGTIHPNLFGAACEYNKAFQIKTMGVAKNYLVGDYEEPDLKQFSKSRINITNKFAGYAFRSADDVKPIYVSSGCKELSSEDAVKIIEPFCIGYRIPELTRQPDIISRRVLKHQER
ncbi:hypothetical protein HOK51_03600 [Candidatus Woesearchaeota archaeon]|jgi:deoxyribonuclease V|nr:hypothetical protein [Candidatus Woesearchaeota archaeon]MBT6518906.1 hypothetical protein [Candidatus Woesearchaeota archaeon]MBT7367574.1 hypothetical protein [Candidatus Woesearchaeota archaeon]